jgi:hypothetical protein
MKSKILLLAILLFPFFLGAQNLWENGGFEDSLRSNWAPYNTGATAAVFTLSTVTPQEGKTCLQGKVTKIDPVRFYDIQVARLKTGITAGQAYSMTFWAKADSARRIGLNFNDPVYASIYGNNAPDFKLTTAWAKYTVTFTPTKTDTASMVIHLGYETGTYFFDNFVFSKVLPPTVGPNMWANANPSFESANYIDKWTPNIPAANGTFSEETAKPQDGLKAFKAVITKLPVNSYETQLLRLGVPLIKDKNYRFTFWGRGDAARKVQFLVQGGAPSYTVYATSTVTTPADGTWQKYTLDYPCTKTDSVFIALSIGYELGTYYFDNFVFSELIPAGTSSVAELTRGNYIVSPNPTSNFVEIRNADVSNKEAVKDIQLFDLGGRLIRRFSHTQTQLDFSDLPNGMYNLRIQTATTLSINKIMKFN